MIQSLLFFANAISESSPIDTLCMNYAALPRHSWIRNQRTSQQIAELKKNSGCKACGLLIHRHSDHYPNGNDINAKPIPARPHNKNDTKLEHIINRDTILLIKSNNDEFSETLTAQQAIRISNDLHADELCSSHELAKGFTQPVESGSLPKIVPEEVEKSREVLMAKRKPNLILKYKTTNVPSVKIGDSFKFSSNFNMKKEASGQVPSLF